MSGSAVLISELTMDLTIEQILKLNKEFYESNADLFSQTRQYPWKGWEKVLLFLNQTYSEKNGHRIKILDLGCGNGRFYPYISKYAEFPIDYVGLDQSENLLDVAKKNFPNATWLKRDFLIPQKELREFQVVVGFGITHHIPDSKTLNTVIEIAKNYLIPGGHLILSFWSQTPKKTQIVKDYGDNSYLLNWEGDNTKQRYVKITTKETLPDFRKQGLKLLTTYEADGKNQKSNIYVICHKE